MKANTLILVFLFAITNCGSKSHNSRCQNFNNAITIVNVGNLDRSQIAKLVEKIQGMNPKVIGMNVLFLQKRQKNSGIEKIIEAQNVVLQAKAEDDTLIKSYFKNQTFGISDFITNTRTNNIDEFVLYRKVNNDTIKSFSVKILEEYSSLYKPNLEQSKYQKIDFNGNCMCFPSVDYRNIDYINKEFIDGNIVLLGYLGEEFEAIECVSDDIDSYSSNYNNGEKMYGTIITANILYTLMKRQGIK